MADVIAGHDWTTSTLGPPEHWPALLQTLVRIMLTSRFPMWLGWGEDLTFFYNEAYARDTLGVKHPWALGRPASVVWSEIWQDIGPRIDFVLRHGEATWDEALPLFLERSGYREETYHTFSYSPVSDATGAPLAMLCVVSEETDRVIGERRMATLQALSSDLSGQRSEEGVFEAVDRRLRENLRDLPFTLTYSFRPDGAAELVSASGIAPGHLVAPRVILRGDAAIWPIADTAPGQARILDGLGERFEALPRGAWGEPPSQAIIVSLAEGGQAAPAGVFIAALNPFRRLDAGYQGFVELVGGQIAAGIAAARVYEAERQRAESLAELDRAKTEFFSNVSHEFRTPLTLILAPTDDALADELAPLPPEQRRRIEVVQRNARRLRRLVNDMLDFARIEARRVEAEKVPTDLAQYTKDIALSFAPAIERAGLGFVLDLPPLGRAVEVDHDMWEKIVLNLISNAFKYTLDGEITVSLTDAGNLVELAVTDTGAGIAADQLPLLFERFHRSPGRVARSHEGTGIGLALVAELTRLHGGTVEVDSVEGEGSRFAVRIPYGDPGAPVAGALRESARSAYLDEALQWVADQPAEVDDAARRALGGTRTDATVLIADDNLDMRSYLRRLLEPFWRVVVAPDGSRALEQMRAERPDLVLSDVVLPELDGFGLLRAIRADPALATVPVVFLSARAGEEAAVEGLEAGADDYLVKPFSGLELIARVRANLDLAALRNQDASWRAALVESLQDAVVVLNGNAEVIEANAAFEQVLGFSRAEVPYALPYPWLPDAGRDPDERRQVEAALAHVLATGELRGVLPLRHRLGHGVLVEVFAKAFTERDDRRIVVAFRDITAELEASAREAALAQLGIRLAEASDVHEVQTAALDELQRVFRATGAAIVSWSPSAPEVIAASGGGALGPAALDALAAARDSRSVVCSLVEGACEQGELCTGVAGVVDSGGAPHGVWLTFSPPRRLRPDERTLFGLLCGYLGQAWRRAKLFDDNRAVATAMQRSILGPTDVPAGFAVRYLPAVQPLEVGGDWYDVLELSKERLAIVVGDCTGRGLDAATTMGQLRSACRALLLQDKGPAETLAALDSFADLIPGARCTTVFCGVLDPIAGSLRYSSAGHLPAVLTGGDDALLLDRARALPLGITPGRARPEVEVDVVPDSSLVLFTDGLIERRDEPITVGLERVRRAVAEHRGLSPEELADVLVGELVAGRQEDDVALVVHRLEVRAAPVLEVDLAADPAVLAGFRKELREWLSSLGADDRVAGELLIAVGEAVANAMEHAYGFTGDERVRVRGKLEEGVAHLVVEDHGRWREPAVPSADRGRGLAIMEALADRVAVLHGQRGTVVEMTRRLRA